METLEQNNQVAIIENSLEVLKTGPEVLLASQARRDQALRVGQSILSSIQENGMDAGLDERTMKFLANANKANAEMKDARAGVTQIMTQLRNMYTEVENELDVKKPGTIPAQLQSHRDQYAKQLAAEREQKRKEAEQAAAKAKEAIDIKHEMESSYKSQFANYLEDRKCKMQAGFNAITLDTYEEKKTKLSSLIISCNFRNEALRTSQFKYHTEAELKSFNDAIIIDNESGLTSNFMADMDSFRDELVERLPSKLAELQEQKRLADEAEEKRIEAERSAAAAKTKAQKEAAEKDLENARIAKEAQDKAAADQKRREEEEEQNRKDASEKKRLEEEQTAAIKKQGEETMVLFEQDAAVAEMKQAPEARQGYEINVLHQVGYTEIFALWFSSEGKNLPIDKIGNTKLDSMKTWAEKQAHKTGTKIESKFLKYEETFKAINRKTK